jgi:hypothetical protein
MRKLALIRRVGAVSGAGILLFHHWRAAVYAGGSAILVASAAPEFGLASGLLEPRRWHRLLAEVNSERNLSDACAIVVLFQICALLLHAFRSVI